MRRFATTGALAVAFACLAVPAPLPAQAPALVLPKASQRATVSQTIGLTEIVITYDRPLVNGRESWRSAPRCGSGAGSCPPGGTGST